MVNLASLSDVWTLYAMEKNKKGFEVIKLGAEKGGNEEEMEIEVWRTHALEVGIYGWIYPIHRQRWGTATNEKNTKEINAICQKRITKPSCMSLT